MPSLVYERPRPETRTLYHMVQENFDTLYGAVDGALAIAIPKFVKKELEGIWSAARSPSQPWFARLT